MGCFRHKKYKEGCKFCRKICLDSVNDYVVFRRGFEGGFDSRFKKWLDQGHHASASKKEQDFFRNLAFEATEYMDKLASVQEKIMERRELREKQIEILGVEEVNIAR